VVEVAVWWVLLFAGYLVLVSPLSGGEFALGAVLSALAGGAAVLARRMSGSLFVVPRGGAGALLRLPAAVLADTWVLATLVWPEVRRRGTPAGALRSLPLADQPDEAREESWQAVAGLMLSLSPGSFVVESGGHPPALLVHAVRAALGPVESAVERSVHR
jgi:multisubunit Na+/H+ antiporter MnhE subunit